tara:strand:+ start:188 stop:319 length:132 start_codon:yes stop_codon:yes gene_type:complete
MNNLGDMTTKMIKGKQYFMIGIGGGKWKYYLIEEGKKPKEVEL